MLQLRQPSCLSLSSSWDEMHAPRDFWFRIMRQRLENSHSPPTQNGNCSIYQFPGKFQDFCRMSMLTHFCQRPFSLLRRWLFQSLLLKVLFLHKVCTGQVTSGPCLCVNTNLMKPNTLCTVTCGMTVVTVRRGTPGGLVEGHGVKGPTGLSSKGMR